MIPIATLFLGIKGIEFRRITKKIVSREVKMTYNLSYRYCIAIYEFVFIIYLSSFRMTTEYVPSKITILF